MVTEMKSHHSRQQFVKFYCFICRFVVQINLESSDQFAFQSPLLSFAQKSLSIMDISQIVEAVLKHGLPAGEVPPATVTSLQTLQLSDISAARHLIRSCRASAGPVKVGGLQSLALSLYGGDDLFLSAMVDKWLETYTSYVASAATVATVSGAVNEHLVSCSYLVGYSLSLADIAMYTLLRKSKFAPNDAMPHASRWFQLIAANLKALGADALPALAAGERKFPPKGAGKSGTGAAPATAAAPTKGKAGAAVAAADDEGEVGSCPALEGAEEGKVCTRFPPEPSGYLHLGHAKAVLLNQYYAQRYKGKMIVRFDDTNPSKEKEEYADNILLDLATLGVKPDKITFTSDSFAKCEEFARKMIKEGKAYMDDTDQEKMQGERMERKDSYRRNTTPDENLTIFEKLLKGEADVLKFCMRAKIDMNSVNGTMRDPVLYRFNDTPHHRTGTKYKAYPTYDFACPIVDSIEGVTHALRTTEYNDRDEQFHWIQEALGVRKVQIYSFGKMNFVNTVLSKRKLNWFVEQKLVEGWFDPRFPTIQGCVRRGVSVDALKNFIISQGASRRVITMEWDKFWAENKRVLEESSARYMGVSAKDMVKFTVTNLPTTDISCVSVQVHPQKPEQGFRVMRQYHEILIDQIDAATFAVGEEVTFLRWGNFFIDEITKDAAGLVTAMTGRYHPEATNFSKTKKTTWLASVPDLVSCTLVQYDHLITKAKLDENDNFQDFVNPHTKSESSAWCDPLLRSVQEGQVIQLERKGFYRCDKAYASGSAAAEAGAIVLIAIPDGKQVKGAPVAQPKAGGKKK